MPRPEDRETANFVLGNAALSAARIFLEASAVVVMCSTPSTQRQSVEVYVTDSNSRVSRLQTSQVQRFERWSAQNSFSYCSRRSGWLRVCSISCRTRRGSHTQCDVGSQPTISSAKFSAAARRFSSKSHAAIHLRSQNACVCFARVDIDVAVRT